MSRRLINTTLLIAIIAFFPLLFKKILPTKIDLAITPDLKPQVEGTVSSPLPPPVAESPAEVAPTPVPKQEEVVVKVKNQVGYAPRTNLQISSPESFPPLEGTIPQPLVAATNFWAKIYGQYSSDQVVLHDQENLNTVYKVLDFTELMKDPNLPPTEKKAIREARVNEATRFLRQSLDISAGENLRSQTGQRDKFVAGLEMSGLYLAEIERIFESYGLPKDLTRLVFVESMFQLNAVSKVGAAGIWQFMPSSGRIFSLKVSPLIDERYDPLLATHAAARHLIRNFRDLRSWPLAINAYNTGAGRLIDAVQRLGTTNIASIIQYYRNPSYGFASRNFYPSFLAARMVVNNYKHYFGDIPIRPPLQYDLATLPRPMTLSEVAHLLEVPTERLRELNPALSPLLFTQARYFPAGSTVRIPAGSGPRFALGDTPLGDSPLAEETHPRY